MKSIAQKVAFIRSTTERYLNEGKKVFLTSSFQTHSIPMLHIFSEIDQSLPVYFLNTGFHFPETILFRDEITTLLHLNLKSLQSPTPKINQRNTSGKFLYVVNPDFCCQINKVLPLEPILAEKDIWVTGVRAEQNKNRASMSFESTGILNTTRFHPMLDWTAKEIFEYRKQFNLPEHPLEKSGYLSVGCEPCTQKFLDGDRDGRWGGMNKNECGLHTDLIEKY